MQRWEEELKSGKHLSCVKLKSWRVVEDQSKSTTRKFVDTVHEHEILETLLEQSKPNIKYYGDEIYFKGLHYLLFTPFRYPPLKWGSRFGTRLERGILYSSIDLHTALSEKAFYIMSFFQASEGALGGKRKCYTAFTIQVESSNFIDLSLKPFSDFEKDISSKEDYQFSQALGKKMRENNVECFQYRSARCINKGLNIGIFTPKVFKNNHKLTNTFKYLNCYSTKELVEFSLKDSGSLTYVFPNNKTILTQ